jgi:hypothetical protein
VEMVSRGVGGEAQGRSARKEEGKWRRRRDGRRRRRASERDRTQMHKCISAELARLACNEEITHVTIAEATGWLDEHKKIDEGEGERAATAMAENKRQAEDGEIQESYS